MKNKLNSLITSSMFLSMSAILVIFQIPYFLAPFLFIDLSFVSLLLARRVVGLRNSIIIALIYPWFSLLSISPNIVGILFMIFQGLLLIVFDYLLFKHKSTFWKVLLNIILISLISYILNMIIFTPLYGSFDESLFIWNEPTLIWIEFVLYFPFNIIKIGISYIVMYQLLFLIK